MSGKRILIVDDETEVTSFFSYFLKQKNYAVTVANTGREVERLLQDPSQDFHAALLDLKLPDANGLDLLQRLKTERPHCEVLIMTGYSTIQSAVTAIQRGARDYLEKPFDDLDQLERMIDSLLASSDHAADELAREAARFGIVYSPESPMAKITAIAKKIAPKGIHVLIQGETGTGKELLARFLHGASLRAQQPFVALNCGAVPETLLESELFGYEKGAFTGAHRARKGFFELANNGTLFLDEIGEAPASIQVKLLRAMETGEFMRVGGEQVEKSNIRFISATNRDLEREVEMNRFRRDLLYRLEGIKLSIPPLRERVEDIPAIAHAYLKKKSHIACEIDPEAMEVLKRYDWPGNVRQLHNVLNQTLALHDCKVLRSEHLPINIRESSNTSASGSASAAAVVPASAAQATTTLEQLIEEECARFVQSLTSRIQSMDELDFAFLVRRIKQVEKEVSKAIIERGLAETHGNRQLLSKKLNITKRTIRYILNEKG